LLNTPFAGSLKPFCIESAIAVLLRYVALGIGGIHTTQLTAFVVDDFHPTLGFHDQAVFATARTLLHVSDFEYQQE
jgi:hypothetical protein